MVIIIMGVAGSGKTTIGELLAERLNLPFYDGDLFHTQASIEKMRRAIPLTDQDRIPWLQSLAALVSESLKGKGAVIACSALKEKYRQILTENHIDSVRFVYLKGSKELIRKRMMYRKGHYMAPNLLESQFQALEEPENALIVSIDKTPEEICNIIQLELHL